LRSLQYAAADGELRYGLIRLEGACARTRGDASDLVQGALRLEPQRAQGRRIAADDRDTGLRYRLVAFRFDRNRVRVDDDSEKLEEAFGIGALRIGSGRRHDCDGRSRDGRAALREDRAVEVAGLTPGGPSGAAFRIDEQAEHQGHCYGRAGKRNESRSGKRHK